MIRRRLWALSGSVAACAVLMASCATSNGPVPFYAISAAYDAEAQVIGPGLNRIRGNAVLRTVGGEPRTCAGDVVHLVRATPYAAERALAAFGAGDRGYRDLYLGDPVFSPEPDHFAASMRSAICDAQGDFEFSGVEDGAYILTTTVAWQVAGASPAAQGGWLMQRVELVGGEDRRVVMSR